MLILIVKFLKKYVSVRVSAGVKKVGGKYDI